MGWFRIYGLGFGIWGSGLDLKGVEFRICVRVQGEFTTGRLGLRFGLKYLEGQGDFASKCIAPIT